jgi:hypothetical protein
MAKCIICKKKINDIIKDIYLCKCNNIYCSNHTNNHNCTYDYQNDFKKHIKNNLPLVTFEKINNIYDD